MGGRAAASSPAGCLERGAWRWRVRHAVQRRGDRLALTVIGIGVVVAPAMVPVSDEVRIAVLVLGVAVLVLGVILPSVAEAEVGVQGIRFKRVVETRDTEFEAQFSETETDELVRFAMHLGVEPAQAARLVSDACVRAYREWHLVPPQGAWLVVLCYLVRRVLSAEALGLLEAAPPAGAADAVLGQLDMRHRALLLLHVYERLGYEQVARILGEPEERIRDDLDDALAVMAAEPDVSTADPS